MKKWYIRVVIYSGFLAKRTAFTSRNGILEFYHRLEKAIGMTE